MKEILKRIIKGIIFYIKMFAKWAGISLCVGIICGFVGFAFFYTVEKATVLRTVYPWLIFLLPVAVMVILVIYRLTGTEGLGTNDVIDSIHFGDKVPLKLVPVIFVSTALTHLCGGSAGREGAALQIGGGIGCRVGKILKLDDKDMRLVTFCGMSAMFAALFGTPLTATVFALEVVSVGVLYYSGLVPCLLAAVSAFGISKFLGFHKFSYMLKAEPLELLMVIKVAVLAVVCAVVSIMFCEAMHHVAKRLKVSIPNIYLRGIIGAALIIVMTVIFGPNVYNGSSEMGILAAINSGFAHPVAFFIKILFTAISLGCGCKGGEIVPSFFIGATLGCVVGPIIGIPASFAAGLGLIAMFCGAFNCPIAAIILSVELFGSTEIIYFAIVSGIAYMLSGYFGIYKSQKILYSKVKAEYIDRYAR